MAHQLSEMLNSAKGELRGLARHMERTNAPITADQIRLVTKLALCWTKDKPTVPGIYLRCNHPSTIIVRQDVSLVDDLPKIVLDGRLVDIPDGFIWYGPIPKVITDGDQYRNA